MGLSRLVFMSLWAWFWRRHWDPSPFFLCFVFLATKQAVCSTMPSLPIIAIQYTHQGLETMGPLDEPFLFISWSSQVLDLMMENWPVQFSLKREPNVSTSGLICFVTKQPNSLWLSITMCYFLQCCGLPRKFSPTSLSSSDGWVELAGLG